MNVLSRWLTRLDHIPGSVFVAFVFVLAAGLRLAFLYSTDTKVHDEMFRYMLNSKLWGGVDGSNLYLSVPAFGGGWRIPSFLFYNLNYFVIQTVGYYGLLILLCLANAVGLVFAYGALRKLFPAGLTAARLTALMACILPFSIFFSAGLWNPHYIFPLLGLALFFYARWSYEKKAYSLVFLSLSLCALSQYHLIGYFVLPALFIVWLIERPPVTPLTLALSLAPWLALAGGYFYFDSLHGYANTRLILEQNSGKKFRTIFDNFSFLVSLVGSGSSDLSMGLKPEMPGIYKRFFGGPVIPWAFHGLHFAWIAAAGIVYFVLGIRGLKRSGFRTLWERHKGAALALCWVFLHVLLFMFVGKGYNTRYVIITFPFAVFMQAAFLVWLLPRVGLWPRLMAGFFVANLVFLLYLNMAMNLYCYREVKMAGLPTTGLMDRIHETILADSFKQRSAAVFVTEPAFGTRSVQLQQAYRQHWNHEVNLARIQRHLAPLGPLAATNRYTTRASSDGPLPTGSPYTPLGEFNGVLLVRGDAAARPN